MFLKDGASGNGFIFGPDLSTTELSAKSDPGIYKTEVYRLIGFLCFNNRLSFTRNVFLFQSFVKTNKSN